MSNLGNKDILAQNLKRLMRIKNVDRNTMCDDLKLKYSTVSEWLSANKYPRIGKIELMANYFGVLKSEIYLYCFKKLLQSNAKRAFKKKALGAGYFLSKKGG